MYEGLVRYELRIPMISALLGSLQHLARLAIALTRGFSTIHDDKRQAVHASSTTFSPLPIHLPQPVHHSP